MPANHLEPSVLASSMAKSAGECWACGSELAEDRPFFALDIRSVRPGEPPPAPYELGEFAVSLCLECSSLTQRILEHVRIARLRASSSSPRELA
jgi:hypothetical protein